MLSENNPLRRQGIETYLQQVTGVGTISADLKENLAHLTAEDTLFTYTYILKNVVQEGSLWQREKHLAALHMVKALPLKALPAELVGTMYAEAIRDFAINSDDSSFEQVATLLFIRDIVRPLFSEKEVRQQVYAELGAWSMLPDTKQGYTIREKVRPFLEEDMRAYAFDTHNSFSERQNVPEQLPSNLIGEDPWKKENRETREALSHQIIRLLQGEGTQEEMINGVYTASNTVIFISFDQNSIIYNFSTRSAEKDTNMQQDVTLCIPLSANHLTDKTVKIISNESALSPTPLSQQNIVVLKRAVEALRRTRQLSKEKQKGSFDSLSSLYDMPVLFLGKTSQLLNLMQEFSSLPLSSVQQLLEALATNYPNSPLLPLLADLVLVMRMVPGEKGKELQRLYEYLAQEQKIVHRSGEKQRAYLAQDLKNKIMIPHFIYPLLASIRTYRELPEKNTEDITVLHKAITLQIKALCEFAEVRSSMSLGYPPSGKRYPQVIGTDPAFDRDIFITTLLTVWKKIEEKRNIQEMVLPFPLQEGQGLLNEQKDMSPQPINSLLAQIGDRFGETIEIRRGKK